MNQSSPELDRFLDERILEQKREKWSNLVQKTSKKCRVIEVDQNMIILGQYLRQLLPA